MPAPGKCPDGLRRRAIRLVRGVPWPIRIGLGGVWGASATGAGGQSRDPVQLGPPGPDRCPVRGSAPPGVEAQRLRKLEKEVRELGGRDPSGRVGFSPVVECERPSR